MDIGDVGAHALVELPGGLDWPGLRADAARVEDGVAGVEDQGEGGAAVHLLDQLEGVQVAHAAVVHAVLVAIHHAVVRADLHQLAHLAEDDRLQLGGVARLVVGHQEGHAAHQLDAQLLHAGQGGQQLLLAGLEVLLLAGMAAPVRDRAAVAVDLDAGLRELLLDLRELLVAHRAEHLAADVAGLDVVPAQFLGDFDLGGEIRRRLVCKSCEEHG